ncbi:hypothetical protein Mapa_007191 [Marchantia paleacea]|nr:hypothetical protein Mapa_007191 [Marchantia paleacea]
MPPTRLLCSPAQQAGPINRTAQHSKTQRNATQRKAKAERGSSERNLTARLPYSHSPPRHHALPQSFCVCVSTPPTLPRDLRFLTSSLPACSRRTDSTGRQTRHNEVKLSSFSCFVSDTPVPTRPPTRRRQSSTHT